jgi:hypothetical protein
MPQRFAAVLGTWMAPYRQTEFLKTPSVFLKTPATGRELFFGGSNYFRVTTPGTCTYRCLPMQNFMHNLSFHERR